MTDRRKPEFKLTVRQIEKKSPFVSHPHLSAPAAQSDHFELINAGAADEQQQVTLN
jgi:hypothetical protein